MMELEGGWSLMSVDLLKQLVFFLMHSYCRLGGGVRLPITPPVTWWQLQGCWDYFQDGPFVSLSY